MLDRLLGQVGNFTTIPFMQSYIFNKRKYGAKSFEIRAPGMTLTSVTIQENLA